MRPDYKRAAEKATETFSQYKMDADNIEPLRILRQLDNVMLVEYSISEMVDGIDFPDSTVTLDSDKDAVTLVNRINGKLKYITIYNRKVSVERLTLALSRELGHVILEHDGKTPEFVWLEEANCFAHHFLCPLSIIQPMKKKEKTQKFIHFRYKKDELLWELKSIVPFYSIEEMLTFIVTEWNWFEHRENIEHKDILLRKNPNDHAGWKNCFDVVLNGKTIGYCNI